MNNEIAPWTKMSPYGMTLLFTLSLGNHHGLIGTTQEFIALVAVLKFIHYIAVRTSKIHEFLVSQIVVLAFYFFIFNSFFRTVFLFLSVYDAILGFFIYCHFKDFSDATLDGAYARYKKSLASYGIKK